jgi:hypothetical protein
MELGPLQTKWLDALESGEYEQTFKGALQDGDGYCCLGVANAVCELKESNEFSLETTYDKLGLHDEVGTFVTVPATKFDYSYLTGMNDVGRFSFEKIAGFIRANPEKVFTRSV